MSDAAQQLSTQEIQPTSQPTPAPTGTLYGAGLKFGADDPVPDYAKGRSAKEILEITETYRRIAEQLSAQQPQSTPQYGYQQAPQAPSSFQGPPDPQLMYSDPAQYQQQMIAYQNSVTQQAIQQVATPFASGLAEQAKWSSQNDAENADAWRRWGHEIESQMASIPVQMRTKQLWDTAAQLVLSKHRKELVYEEAQKLAASGGFGTERAAPAGAVPVSGSFGDPVSELFSNAEHPEVAKMRAEGITPTVLREYLSKTGKDPKAYVADVLGGNTFSGGAK